MTRAYLKARYSYPLFSRNQRGYLYVWTVSYTHLDVYKRQAPNTLCVKIENCYVNADITGARAVGGLFGGEGGCDQAWDNGIGYIRNSVFYGALHLNDKEVAPPLPAQAVPADNIGGSKGAVAGFMRSLNKWNVIENNYYFITNGEEEKGIGAVEHIDTSKIRPMGMRDGVYYYDTSKDSLKEVCDWVDREDGIGREYSAVTRINHNRCLLYTSGLQNWMQINLTDVIR